MSIQHITTLLDVFNKNTYFLFQGMYYKQVHGKTMGSPITPIIANLFMEEFETKAIDTFVIQKAEHSIQFLQHIKSIDQHIQYIQGNTHRWFHSFLDTLISPGPDNNLLTRAWKKTYPHRRVSTLGQPPQVIC